MCRGRLTAVIPCSCSSGVKLTKMTSNTESWSPTTVVACSTTKVLQKTAGHSPLKELDKNSHQNRSSRSSIKRRLHVSSRRVRPQVHKRMSASCNKTVNNSLDNDKDASPTQLSSPCCVHPMATHSCMHPQLSVDLLSSVPMCTSGAQTSDLVQSTEQSPPEVKTSRKPVRSRSSHSLHAIIPTPVLDNELQKEEEYTIHLLSKTENDELVTEKIKENYYQCVDDEDSMDLPYLSPLELIGLDSDSTLSDTQSVIDLDSILMDELDSTDIGPSPVPITDEDLSTQTNKEKVIFRSSMPRCRSMSDIHRRIRVLDELLYSIDLECGSSDTGPKPEILLDRLHENEPPMTVAESTKEQPTNVSETKNHISITRRSSDTAAIIDSIFAPKRDHSCCKNRRKSSWNVTAKRKRSSRLKHVPRRRPRKIVVVGDMCSGKSGLISAYSKDRFCEMYVPTILRSCLTDADLYGEKIELVVIEVSGREDYIKLRRCAYRKTDAVILCYSCDNISSLDKVKSHWVPELQTYSPNVPYILVGTKKDIREEMLDQLETMSAEERAQSLKRSGNDLKTIKGKLVSPEHGYDMSQSIGAHSFHECSARYRDGTRSVFETVAKVAMQKSRRKKKVQRTSDVCSVM